MTGPGRRLTMEDWLAARMEAGQLAAGRPDRLSGLLPGLYRSFLKGRGLEYDESRRFQPGDDFAHIDWRVTARTGQPYTKSFREERERTVLFALDFSRSMRFGTRRCFKWVRGAELIALIAWLAADNGDRVGCVAFGLRDGALELRPGLGESAAMRLYRVIQTAADLPAAETGDLARAMGRMQRHAEHGALMVVVTDFRGSVPEDRYGLAALARNNDLCLAHVHDPMERALPPREPLAVQTPTGLRVIGPDDTGLRDTHAGEFQRRRNRLETRCRETGARYMSVGTEVAPLPALLDWSRAQGVGRAGSTP